MLNFVALQHAIIELCNIYCDSSGSCTTCKVPVVVVVRHVIHHPLSTQSIYYLWWLCGMYFINSTSCTASILLAVISILYSNPVLFIMIAVHHTFYITSVLRYFIHSKNLLYHYLGNLIHFKQQTCIYPSWYVE